MECRICFEENYQEATLHPCGHGEVCVECAPKLRLCPTCNDTLCITVRFKHLNGTLYKLQVDPWETAWTIKRLLEPIIGFVREEIQLVFGGRVIGDDRTFHHCHVKNKDIVHIVLNQRGD